MLEPLLKHIRFTTMSLEVMHEVIGPARILEPREISAILTHITGPDHQKIHVPYKTSARRIPFSKQETVSGVSSIDGLFNDLILNYSEEGESFPCCPRETKKHCHLVKVRSSKK
jgi:hypothetical protein